MKKETKEVIKIFGENKWLIPQYKTEGAACADLSSSIDIQLRPWEFKYVPTWVKVVMPEGWKAHIYGRSSLPKKKHLMFTGTGIIDWDYRWEIMMPIFNFSEDTVEIRKQERVGQIEFLRMDKFEIEENTKDYWKVEELYPSDRGEWGLGSTWA